MKRTTFWRSLGWLACLAIAWAQPMAQEFLVTYGGQVTRTWNWTDGTRDQITLNAAGTVRLRPHQITCDGETFLSQTGELNTSNHVWGTAVRRGSMSNYDYTLDNTSLVTRAPSSTYSRFTPETADYLYLETRDSVSAPPDKVTVYAWEYVSSQRVLRLWVALPEPFYYPDESFEHYDFPATHEVSGESDAHSWLYGTVVDSQGSGVSGARVNFGGILRTADAQGRFEYPDVPAGTYRLSVTQPGFMDGEWIETIPPFSILHRAYELEMQRVTIAMFRTEVGTAVNGGADADADTPIALRADPTVLGGAGAVPITGGLVADGVTPLLFKLTETVPTTAPTTYRLTLEVNSGGSLNGGIGGHLRALQGGKFVTANAAGVAAVTLAAHSKPTADAFAYVAGIRAEDVRLGPGSTELACTLTTQRVNGTGQPLGGSRSINFKVRLPPIVLVHGFNSDGKWKNTFHAPLLTTRPASFVQELHYGITHGDKTENTYGDFFSLAVLLDRELQLQVEGRGLVLPPWRNEWAYTRYDIVAHSQGGVLTRMLCTERPFPWNPAANVTAYRNPVNFHRGRFHRVVTIGSPQNGTTLLHYLLQLRDRHVGDLKGWILPASLGSLYQAKFDPWGHQTANLNRPGCEVDAAAKFHVIQAHISGTPLLFQLIGLDFSSPLCGLETVQEVVLPAVSSAVPYGSDGVVDLRSQAVDYRTKGSLFDEVDVTHAPVGRLFGTSNGETDYGPLARRVRDLLDGASTEFGPFQLPAPAPTAWKERIDAMVDCMKQAILLDAVISHLPVLAGPPPNDGPGRYAFRMTPSNSAGPIAGEIHWFAEVFGPDGITTDGLALEVDPADPSKVTVVVEPSVVGEVVVYATYLTTRHELVAAPPTRVVFRPPNEVISAIALLPAKGTLAVDDDIVPEIWATYADGTHSRLFIATAEATTLVSDNPEVVSVEPGWRLRARRAGTASIAATHGGLSALASITVSPRLRFLQAQAKPLSGGIVSGDGFHPDGGNATLTAVANPEQVFLGWFDGDSLLSRESTYAIVVDADRTLEARFGSTAPRLEIDAPPWRGNYLRLRLQGPVGVRYDVQGSTNLLDWMTMTNVLSTGALTEIEVLSEPGIGRSFLRLRIP